jgi:hypothetical protein
VGRNGGMARSANRRKAMESTGSSSHASGSNSGSGSHGGGGNSGGGSHGGS